MVMRVKGLTIAWTSKPALVSDEKLVLDGRRIRSSKYLSVTI